jgi:hypothetical protein
MTILEWLDTIDAQTKAATAGPWLHTHKDCKDFMSSDFIDREGDPNGVALVTSDINQHNVDLYATEADMDFIAASRMNVPQLVALLREACRLLTLTPYHAFDDGTSDAIANFLAKEVGA